MITLSDLASRLLESAEGRISIEQFEEWFDSASWDVHRSRVGQLVDAVFEIEGLFSDYNHNQKDADSMRRSFHVLGKELESKVPTFVESYVIGISKPQDIQVEFKPMGKLWIPPVLIEGISFHEQYEASSYLI